MQPRLQNAKEHMKGHTALGVPGIGAKVVSSNCTVPCPGSAPPGSAPRCQLTCDDGTPISTLCTVVTIAQQSHQFCEVLSHKDHLCCNSMKPARQKPASPKKWHQTLDVYTQSMLVSWRFQRTISLCYGSSTDRCIYRCSMQFQWTLSSMTSQSLGNAKAQKLQGSWVLHSNHTQECWEPPHGSDSARVEPSWGLGCLGRWNVTPFSVGKEKGRRVMSHGHALCYAYFV